MSRLKTNASQAKQSVEQHISNTMDGYDGYHVQKDIAKIFDNINLAITNAIQQLQTSCSIVVSVSRKKIVPFCEKTITNELTTAGYKVQNMAVTYAAPNTTPVTPSQLKNKKVHKTPEATISFTVDWS